MTRLFCILLTLLFSLGGPAMGKNSDFGAWSLAANSGSRIASEVGLNAGEITRIQNAANRIGKPINLVGSRASGTANAASDWDYVIEGMTNANKNAIKNSLPGAPIRADQVPRNIDFFTDSLRTDLPHIQFTPRQP